MGAGTVRRAGAWTAYAVAAALVAAVVGVSAGCGGPDHQREPAQHVDVYAHRGASAQAPENTVAAFKLAIAQRADFIETDVQEAKDGALVLIHDSTLERTTDVEKRFPDRAPWNVGDFTLAEIKTLDAGSWYGPKFAGERIPTLDRFLDLVGGRIGVDLEIKSPELYPGVEQEVADTLTDHEGWTGKSPKKHLVVSSFDWGSLRTFHKQLPKVHVSAIASRVPGGDELDGLAKWADSCAVDFHHLDRGTAGRVRDAGLGLVAWTVDEPEHMREVFDWGATAIATDRPKVALRLLRERSP
ncbi:MAG: glycerophosphodiester phosphodiesterase [Streptosporangiales bacterium]